MTSSIFNVKLGKHNFRITIFLLSYFSTLVSACNSQQTPAITFKNMHFCSVFCLRFCWLCNGTWGIQILLLLYRCIDFTRCDNLPLETQNYHNKKNGLRFLHQIRCQRQTSWFLFNNAIGEEQKSRKNWEELNHSIYRHLLRTTTTTFE